MGTSLIKLNLSVLSSGAVQAREPTALDDIFANEALLATFYRMPGSLNPVYPLSAVMALLDRQPARLYEITQTHA